MNNTHPGTVVAGRYRLIAPIGQGGMGTVYKAADITRDRFVAIKLLNRASIPLVHQHIREARALAPLKHPNILSVLDVGDADGCLYLVTEFIEGRSLAELLRPENSLDTNNVIDIITQIGEGLAFAHQAGIVHRDVKPGNILVSDSGQALLSDFGVAVRSGDATLTLEGTVLGTPAYMSPEQAMGQPLDGRSDIYSLGVVLYEALTRGAHSARAREPTSAILKQVVETRRPPVRQANPNVSVAVARIVERALEMRPDDRFGTADEFVHALRVAGNRADAPVPQPGSIKYDGSFEAVRSALWWRQLSRIGWAGLFVVLTIVLLGVAQLTDLDLLASFRQWRGEPTLVIGTVFVLLVMVAWLALQRHARASRPAPSASGGSAISNSVVAGNEPLAEQGPSTQRTEDTSVLREPRTPSSDLPETGAFAPYGGTFAPHASWLLVIDGPLRGWQFQLGSAARIGRSSENEVVLGHDDGIAQRHAEIAFRNNKFHLRDLGSQSGTLVNGFKVQDRELRDRDQIHVGSTTLLFVSAVGAEKLGTDAKPRLEEFSSIWDEMTRGTEINKDRLVAVADRLASDLLREAIGYRIEQSIPYLKGTVGYMVEAPLLWIRHSRFPILFVVYDRRNHDLLATVIQQLEIAKATEFFALIIVVSPGSGATGAEAEEVRHIVADSVYRHDFVVLDREHVASIIAEDSSQRLIEIILQQGIELSALSPYVVSGPVPGSMFFGRDSEIKTISQNIVRTDFAVVGGRRIGKSSILLRLRQLFENDPRFRAIYIDCEARFDYEDFFAGLGQHLDAPVNGDPLSFQTVAAKLREQSPASTWVFLVDEIDELLAFDAGRAPAGRLFKTFRAASHEGACRFVFSGSRALFRHLRDAHSPFFNFCEAITLQRLQEKSVVEIVRKPMRQLGIELPDEEQLLLRLVELTSAHPNLAQWVCDRLIKTCSGRRIPSRALVHLAASADFYEHYLSTAWGDSTPLEKLISLLMDAPLFSEDDVQQKLATCGLVRDQPAIRESLDILELYSLLERDGLRYRFGLSQFPRIARESGAFATQLESLINEVRSRCS